MGGASNTYELYENTYITFVEKPEENMCHGSSSIWWKTIEFVLKIG
jgi:hypothetical protein